MRSILSIVTPAGVAGCLLSCGLTEVIGSGADTSDAGGQPDGAPITGSGGQNGTPLDIGAVDSSADACPKVEGLPLGCPGARTQAELVKVNALLVVDKSTSMTKGFPGSSDTRWKALRDALATALIDTQGVMNYGLELFPTEEVEAKCEGDGCCTVNSNAAVRVGVGRGTDVLKDILSALQEAQPGGGTPTAKALTEARIYFESGPGTTLDGDRVVLLATDGGPNCNAGHDTCSIDQCTYNVDEMSPCDPTTVNCCEPMHIGCLDDAASLAAVRELASVGIKTIVLGIPGSGSYADVLGVMAKEGGEPNPQGSPAYYRVDSVAELTSTIRAITTRLVTSCVVELAQVPYDVNELNVAVDCQVLRRQGESSGSPQWEYHTGPPASIEILGTTCAQIMNFGVRRVDVLVGCPVVE